MIGLAMSHLPLSCVVCWFGEGALDWPRMKVLICLLLTTWHFHVLNRSFFNNFSMFWVLDMFRNGVGGWGSTLDPLPLPCTPCPPFPAWSSKTLYRAIKPPNKWKYQMTGLGLP